MFEFAQNLMKITDIQDSQLLNRLIKHTKLYTTTYHIFVTESTNNTFSSHYVILPKGS